MMKIVRNFFRRRRLERMLAEPWQYYWLSPWNHGRGRGNKDGFQVWADAWYTRFYDLRDMLDLDYDRVMAEMDKMRNL